MYFHAHKYNAKPVEIDGIKFASTGEARRWQELKLLEKAGKITGLTRQTRWPLKYIQDGKRVAVLTATGKTYEYRPDFEYYENGEHILEDYKGVITDIAALKIAMMKSFYGITVRITGRNKREAA